MAETDGEGPPEKVSFTDLILSMATNAMVHLGGDAGDDRVPSAADVALAAQHIDMLAMLKDKTRGNLDDSEEQLLDSLLYDLRMRYVEVLKDQGS